LKFKFFFISFLQQKIYRSTNQKRVLETTEKQGHNPCFFHIITLVLKAAKQPLTTARSAGEIKA